MTWIIIFSSFGSQCDFSELVTSVKAPQVVNGRHEGNWQTKKGKMKRKSALVYPIKRWSRCVTPFAIIWTFFVNIFSSFFLRKIYSLFTELLWFVVKPFLYFDSFVSQLFLLFVLFLIFFSFHIFCVYLFAILSTLSIRFY